MRITFLSICLFIVLPTISIAAQAKHVVQFHGYVTDDTCSTSSTAKKCQDLKKTAANLLASDDATTTARIKNPYAKIAKTTLQDNKHVVVTADYY